MDAERAEVPVVDAQGLDELVRVGLGVDVGAAEPVDPVGDDRAGRLAGDAVEVGAEDGPGVGGIDGRVDALDVERVDGVGCLRFEVGDVLLLDRDVIAGTEPFQMAADE
jgi:hypothetical protein